MIRGVGKVLGLQRKTLPATISMAMLANSASIQEVARVELYSRFRGVDFENSSADRVTDAGCQIQFTRASIDYKIVIVAARQKELLVVIVDTRTDS